MEDFSASRQVEQGRVGTDQLIWGHVAIVGRPNVGKSTLYNALLQQRRAITSPEAGLTRDVITQEVCLRGLSILLSDTGGICTEQPHGAERQLQESIQQRSLAVLQEADLLLWVVAQGEFGAEDQQLLSKLQPQRGKTLLVVNKVDSPERAMEAYNFYQLGFPQLALVSALHRRGLDELQSQMAAFLQQSQKARTVQPSAGAVRLTLIGKPNTGKSTLSNRLTGGAASLVSELPGTTRDVLLQSFTQGGQSYQLADTAGIRRKRKVREGVEYYSVHRAIKSLDQADVAVLLIDSREGVQQQDKKIAQQIVQRGRGLVFALNKIDLLQENGTRDGGRAQKAALRRLRQDTRELFPHLHYAPICTLSALSGRGTAQLLREVCTVYEQLHRRINTGLLNQALQDWLRYHPPPSSGAVRFKARYLTQVQTNPLCFVLFVNRSKGFPQSYLSFLQNQIRSELGFSAVPLDLQLRE